jgi:amidase
MRILDPIVFPDNAFGTVALHGTLDLTGMQALTMNGGFAKHGAPIGFQLVGKHLSEDLLLRAGRAYQSITDWHTRHPAVD